MSASAPILHSLSRTTDHDRAAAIARDGLARRAVAIPAQDRPSLRVTFAAALAKTRRSAVALRRARVALRPAA